MSAEAVTMTFNARAKTSPQRLEEITRDVLDRMTAGRMQMEIQIMNTLSPGRPDPTYRYDRVVE